MCWKHGQKEEDESVVSREVEELKEGSREDKTRAEVCILLRNLSDQLSMVAKTIDDIGKTLYNEEYE